MRRIKGKGVQTCSEIEEKAPELAAELELEVQQEQRQKEQEQKRAASNSSASNSKPSKQQKLESSFANQSKARVDAAVAAFFYAEGIPFAKVGRRCITVVGGRVGCAGGSEGAVQCVPFVKDIQLSHAGQEQVFQRDAGSCCQPWRRLSATQQ